MAQELLNQPAEKLAGRVKTRGPGEDTSPLRESEQHPILHLQRTLGNRAVGELIRSGRLTPNGRLIPLQPKLIVGAADDPLEHEAEQVVQRVVSTPDSAVAAHSDGGGHANGIASQTHTLSP